MTQLQKFNEVVAYCKKVAPKRLATDDQWTHSEWNAFLNKVDKRFKPYKSQWVSSGGGFEHILIPLDEHNHISVNPVYLTVNWYYTRKAFKDTYKAFWHEVQKEIRVVDFITGKSVRK